MTDALIGKILDPERLAALERAAILDTASEQGFDELTRLACALCRAPVALVSLVDKDRQFFKSCIGLPEPYSSTRQTPLSHSFCKHAVMSGQALVIEDAREHPLVRDNPAIEHLGIIAYAGIPLRTREGHVLGTLCVIDRVPRKWNPEHIQLLEHLAGCVVSRIELGAALDAVARDATHHRASQARLTAILDSTLDAVVTIDGAGVITGWNCQASGTFGWTAEEVVGHPLVETIIPARYREAHLAGMARFHATGDGPILRTRIEISAVDRDGREFPVELTITPFTVDGGWHFSAFIRDITERRQVDQALRVATERFQLVARATNDAVWDWDLIHDTTWQNEGFEVLFGYRRAPGEQEDAPWRSRLHPADRERILTHLDATLAGAASTWSDEYRFRRADGSYASVFDRGYIIRNQQGTAVRMVGAMSDITALRQAEQLQRALYRIAQATSTVAGLAEVLRTVHETVSELLPARNFYIALYDAAHDLISFPYFVDERDPAPDPRPPRRGLTERVLETGASLLVTPEVFQRLQDEGLVHLVGAPSVDWLGVPLKTRDRTIGVLAVQSYAEGVRYTTREQEILEFVSTQVAMAIERKEVEQSLTERETRYRLLFEANPEAMFVYDRETLRFLAVNPAAVRRYGYSVPEFLGMTIRDIRPPSEQERLEAVLAQRATGARYIDNVRHLRKGGEPIDVEILSDGLVFAGRPARLVLVRDVSERRRLESQLRQSQKMEAVGRLAGGIAHDFNNLLTAITGYSDLLLHDLSPEDPRRQDVEEIGKATARAAALTQQLLAFSRKQVLQPRVIDLNMVVNNARNLLQRLIGEHITLETSCAPDLGAVRADLAQFEQVIVNLAVNARDAMPQGGKLLIETRNVSLEDAHLTEDSVISPDGYVQLTVTDTGIGMDDETKARLFEPFFTTKGLGKGTGLGLSTVYGIVKQSGGTIWVYSEPGTGTTFKIYLPRVNAEAEPLGPSTLSLAAPRGDETILFVEDEPALRAVACRSLAMQGYRVMDAPDAETALAMAAGFPGTIHLMVTDVIMPGLSGHELARRLTAAREGLRVLYISGYTDDAIVSHGVLAPGVSYLQKPFSPDTLARRVREVLDAPRPRPRT
jgi:PAS domain S-box-containing protein